MKIFIPLFLILFNAIINDDDGYGIDKFIEELIETGLYDLLKDIKDNFGIEVAIETCLLIYETNDCETVIRVYMNPLYKGHSERPSNDTEGDPSYDMDGNIQYESNPDLLKIYDKHEGINLKLEEKNFEILKYLFLKYKKEINKKKKDPERIFIKIVGAFPGIFGTLKKFDIFRKFKKL